MNTNRHCYTDYNGQPYINLFGFPTQNVRKRYIPQERSIIRPTNQLNNQLNQTNQSTQLNQSLIVPSNNLITPYHQW